VHQPNMIAHVTEDAQALLQAAQVIHGERHGAQTFTPGIHLPLEEAGERTRIGSNSIHYHDAIEELEYEGAIEWDTSARYARGASTTSSPSAAWMIWVVPEEELPINRGNPLPNYLGASSLADVALIP
jgi:hypothetical protein